MITKNRITNMTVLRQDKQNFKFVLKTDITALFCLFSFLEYGQSACCKFPTACRKRENIVYLYQIAVYYVITKVQQAKTMINVLW